MNKMTDTIYKHLHKSRIFVVSEHTSPEIAGEAIPNREIVAMFKEYNNAVELARNLVSNANVRGFIGDVEEDFEFYKAELFEKGDKNSPYWTKIDVVAYEVGD